MGNIIEDDVWSDVIRQLEENEMVEGGADGIDNIPHKQLAGRTNWLRDALGSLSLKTSGTNTGDETADTIKTKLGVTGVQQTLSANYGLPNYGGEIVTRTFAYNTVYTTTVKCRVVCSFVGQYINGISALVCPSGVGTPTLRIWENGDDINNN
jgi:hypothetical protein